MTYFQIIKLAKRKIKARSLDPYVAVYLIQRRFKLSNTRLLMNYSQRVPQDRARQYKRDVQEYLDGESPQYIIGTASFYGYNFRVNHHVLIPRPETEGLVDWILRDHDQDPLRVVDIGTGSGAIAIALKLQRPCWKVTATDISGSAISVAKLNARLHRAHVKFKRCDLFHGLAKGRFDVIVSNPPYVSRTEIPEMGPDVLRNEPHRALFAKHHGMAMYQRIAHDFTDYLRPSGALYLEIGFREKSRVVRLFKSQHPGYKLMVRKDLANHPRMVKVQR